MTELDILWKDIDEKMKPESTGKLFLPDKKMKKMKLNLYQIPLNHLLNIILITPFIYFLFNFCIAHYDEVHFIVPSSILLLVTTGSFAYSLLTLKNYYAISSNESILVTQKKMEKLRLLQLWETRSLLVIIPAFSGPFLIVMAKYLANINLYEWMGIQLIWFTAGSLAIAIILVIILQLFPDQKLRESIQYLKELNEMA